MASARQNRNGHRDATMTLVTFRHGLRATEVCQLRWDQYDMKRGTLHVNRIKNGIESVHPVGGEELRSLQIHRKEVENRYVFVSERGAPLTQEGFLKMIKRNPTGGSQWRTMVRNQVITFDLIYSWSPSCRRGWRRLSSQQHVCVHGPQASGDRQTNSKSSGLRNWEPSNTLRRRPRTPPTSASLRDRNQ